MKKTIAFAVTALLLCGCEPVRPVSTTPSGGTKIETGQTEVTIYIVEKDGYKLAVAVGVSKCAMVQLKD